MRRVVPVILATLGVLALLATFHTTPASVTRVAVRAPAAPPAASAPPPPTSPDSSATTPPTIRTVDGPIVSNRFGDVEVQVKTQGGRLIDAQAVQLPEDRERSALISQYAGPKLRAEALRAQSASIDIVSGATYTSDSYAQSLQAALDQAGIH